MSDFEFSIEPLDGEYVLKVVEPGKAVYEMEFTREGLSNLKKRIKTALNLRSSASKPKPETFRTGLWLEVMPGHEHVFLLTYAWNEKNYVIKLKEATLRKISKKIAGLPWVKNEA